MANDHNPEDRPIVDESTVERQNLEVAMMQLHEVIQTVKSPTSTFVYDINCDTSTHLEALEEIMGHIEDAWCALDTKALPTGDEDKMWCNFLIPEMSKLNCGHHPQRAYRLGNGDLVGECLKCNYSAVQNIHSDDEFKAELEAERQADAQAELEAELCYGDDFDGGWY